MNASQSNSLDGEVHGALAASIINLTKALLSVFVLILISRESQGSLAFYGQFQNLVLIIVAVLTLSAQNGITVHVATSEKQSKPANIFSHLLGIAIVGCFILAVITCFAFVSLGDPLQHLMSPIYEISSSLFYWTFAGVALLGAIQIFASAVYVGMGKLIIANALELVKVIVLLLILAALGVSPKTILLGSLFAALFVSFFIFINEKRSLADFHIRKEVKFYTPRFDNQTRRICKASFVTLYCAILLPSVLIFLRLVASEEGLQTADHWELILRISALFQLVIVLPLSQILMRKYSLNHSAPPMKRMIFVLFGAISLLTLFFVFIPSDLLDEIFKFVFSFTIPDAKLTFFLLLVGELIRTMGIFYHNLLVAKFIVIPQIIFESFSQLIIVVFVVSYAQEVGFVMAYCISYFFAYSIWTLLNIFFTGVKFPTSITRGLKPNEG